MASVPPQAAPDKAPDRIAAMFDAIAPRYDLLNHLLSAGVDRRWRARAIESLRLTGRETLVDVCTGTGDVALEAGGRAARVLGIDFAGAMLALGRRKVLGRTDRAPIALVRGDATRLPARDGCADAATVAFGLRNVQQPEAACREMARVLRTGGRLAILEFGLPRLPAFRAMYLWYFRTVLPRIGRAISGHGGAYAYLPASVGTFATPEEVVQMLRGAGFAEIRADPLTFGIVYLYTAVKPQPPGSS